MIYTLLVSKEINTSDAELEALIKASLGCSVRFSNGCFLSLVDVNGFSGVTTLMVLSGLVMLLTI